MSDPNIQTNIQKRMNYAGCLYSDYGKEVGYRVLTKDMQVVCYTYDKKKAERLAAIIDGHIHGIE